MMLYIVMGREVPERNPKANREFKALQPDHRYGRYTTFEEADKVAGELAAKWEGQEFLIFKAVGLVRSAICPIIHERFE